MEAGGFVIMKKLIAIYLCAILIAVGFTVGCTQTKAKQKVVETGKVSEEDKSKDGSGSNVEADKKDVEDTNNKEKKVTSAGVYAGQIDANSIEVSIDGNPTALFFSEEIKNSFNPKLFKVGANVEVVYSENSEGQKILSKIVVSEAAEDDDKEGTYVGQIDNNSVEILIDGSPTAFFFSDDLKSSFNPKAFKKGNRVKIQYEKNANGQLILERIDIK